MPLSPSVVSKTRLINIARIKREIFLKAKEREMGIGAIKLKIRPCRSKDKFARSKSLWGASLPQNARAKFRPRFTELCT